MGPVVDRMFVIVVLDGLASWVTWGLQSWVSTRPKSLGLAVRCSLAGFILASLSATLEIASGLYAQFHTFAFEDPSLLRIYRCGVLLALLGLLSALMGLPAKSPLRWKAPLLSGFMFVLWMMQAMGE